MSLLLTILAFGIMIMIHELGHFLVARAFGVRIETFSLGFGKPIFNIERGGTNFRISWLPLGGYVKMKGENPDEEADGQWDSFKSKTWWQRALIALAGPFANLILAILIFIVSFLLPQRLEDSRPVIGKAEGIWAAKLMPGDSLAAVNGKPVKGFGEAMYMLDITKENTLKLIRQGETMELKIPGAQKDSLIASLQPVAEAIVGDVSPGYPAWRAGLKSGDRITQVDSVQVIDWYQMRELIIGSKSPSVLLEISRGDSLLTRRITLEANILDNQNTRMIGITQHQPVRYSYHYKPGEAIVSGFTTTLRMIVMNYYGLYRLFQKPESLSSNLGGPVMIVTMSQSVGSKGMSSLLLFFGGISLILMIMNLLPIPILDGGQIMFCLIEGIFRKPLPLRTQEIAQRIGFSLLIMLMVFAFYSDIQKLVLRLISS